jgi:hypothetical protein
MFPSATAECAAPDFIKRASRRLRNRDHLFDWDGDDQQTAIRRDCCRRRHRNGASQEHVQSLIPSQLSL